MGKHHESSEQTKQNLREAFWELYCVKRIEKITVREITEKAGYNRSTFYEYFIDVHDVLEQIENSLIPQISELPPFDFSAEQPIDSFIKMYSENSKYYSVLLGVNGDPSFAAKLKNSIKAKLKAQIKATEMDELELDYSLEFVLAAMIGVLTHWFQSGGDIPKERLLALIYGLLSGEGIHGLQRLITS